MQWGGAKGHKLGGRVEDSGRREVEGRNGKLSSGAGGYCCASCSTDSTARSAMSRSGGSSVTARG